MQVREIIYSLVREELLIYNIIFIFTLHVHVSKYSIYTILTWSLDVPNLFAISIFSMILKLVYFQRSSPSSMFFWGFLSSGKVPITCLMEKNLFDTIHVSILGPKWCYIYQIFITRLAHIILWYTCTLYYFWQSFFMYMYMNWPVTSGVEASYVWNVSDQGIL